MNKKILCKCLLERKDEILVFSNFTSLVLISTMIALLVIIFRIKLDCKSSYYVKCVLISQTMKVSLAISLAAVHGFEKACWLTKKKMKSLCFTPFIPKVKLNFVFLYRKLFIFFYDYSDFKELLMRFAEIFQNIL